MKRCSTPRTLILCLFVTACGGHTCEDPPAGTEEPDGIVNKGIEGCANTGPQAEEFTGGSEYQCAGSANPILFGKVYCTESAFCPDPAELYKSIAHFSFGEESYENLSMGACCGDSVEEADLSSSCDYSCGTTICDQMLPYLKWVRSSNDEMKKMCCMPTDSGGYDCSTSDILLDVCKTMLDKYISRVQETDGWGADDTLSWNGYCKSLVASGIPDPDVTNYNYDALCGGIYLGDLDFDQSIAHISVRNTCIYPRCDIDSPPTQALPDSPRSCTATGWSEMPEGWPESAWEPKMDADVESGEATVILSGGLGSLLGDEGFSKNVTRGISDGKVLYGLDDCDGAGNCTLKINDIYAHASDFTMEGDTTIVGKKKLKIRDTYLYLNRIAYGSISAPDASGIRYFEIADGGMEVTLKSGAKGYLDFFIGGSDTYFDKGNQTMVAWNTGEAYGYIDSEDRLVFTNLEFIDGDLSIALSFTSAIPNHAPEAKGTATASVCGGQTTLDATQSFDTDGDPLVYEWYVDGQVFTDMVVTTYFTEGQHTAFLTVKDSQGLVGRLPVTFHTMDDHVPPDIQLTDFAALGTCGPSQSFAVESPDAIDFCGGDTDVTGAVIQRNGAVLSTPLPIVDGFVTLEPGQYVIEWTAVDESGNTSTASQSIDIRSGIRTTNSLKLNNGAKIVLNGSGYASVSNSGQGTADFGVEAKIGTVVSKGNVSLADRSSVYGDIRTSGQVIYQNRNTITVTGSVFQNQALTFGSLLTDSLDWVVFPPRSNQPLYFNPRGTPYNILPGSYPETYLNSGATVVLSAGTYYFKSLIVNDASQLRVNAPDGSVQIFVENTLNLYEPIVTQSNQTAKVFLGYKGTNQINLEASFNGTLVAPNAKIVMGTASFKAFGGRYVAKDLELGVNVTLTCDAGATDVFEPEENCSDGILNQNETGIDCGGDCVGCADGNPCGTDDDCQSGNCDTGVCQAIPGSCTEFTAIDMGSDGNAVTVQNNGCVMVRNNYPSWWGSRNMQLQSMDGGTYPVLYSWTNTCAAGSGNGTINSNWQSVTFGPTSSQCATLIDLGGSGAGTIKLRYYAN